MLLFFLVSVEQEAAKGIGDEGLATGHTAVHDLEALQHMRVMPQNQIRPGSGGDLRQKSLASGRTRVLLQTPME